MGPQPQERPCLGPLLTANSIHRPHCILNLKKTRRHAQQLVHKTLITIPLLERLLTSEGVTHRSDGKTLMGQHVARPRQGRAPGTGPCSAFPDQLPALAPRILRTSLGTPKQREPSLHLPIPPNTVVLGANLQMAALSHPPTSILSLFEPT